MYALTKKSKSRETYTYTQNKSVVVLLQIIRTSSESHGEERQQKIYTLHRIVAIRIAWHTELVMRLQRQQLYIFSNYGRPNAYSAYAFNLKAIEFSRCDWYVCKSVRGFSIPDWILTNAWVGVHCTNTYKEIRHGIAPINVRLPKHIFNTHSCCHKKSIESISLETATTAAKVCLVKKECQTHW